ncbi:MAG: hypothetical protein COB04_06480 [Gammaproteobacteria bacterium]|nr:MAG: hypothetical protein COB04_06480 [Gammaproteobacteria bacterium]
MNFNEFADYAPFRRLREKMRAEQSGEFELFDVENHLTRKEKDSLVCGGLLVQRSQLRVLRDSTLAYKNSRVLQVLAVDAAHADLDLQYHFSDCQNGDRLNGIDHNDQVLLFTCLSVVRGRVSDDGRRSGAWRREAFTREVMVCKRCVQKINFESLAGQRNKRRQFRQAGNLFCVDSYFKRFRKYPLSDDELGDEFLF